MVFLRKSAADCCRARGLVCHLSRLIYPPPLSSCYAWSLNFPFLLFFPCFCSKFLLQFSLVPFPFASRFSDPPLFRTRYASRTCRGVSSLRSWLGSLKTCHPARATRTAYAHLKKPSDTSAIAAASFIYLKKKEKRRSSGAALFHKRIMPAISCMINREVTTSQYCPTLKGSLTPLSLYKTKIERSRKLRSDPEKFLRRRGGCVLAW